MLPRGPGRQSLGGEGLTQRALGPGGAGEQLLPESVFLGCLQGPSEMMLELLPYLSVALRVDSILDHIFSMGPRKIVAGESGVMVPLGGVVASPSLSSGSGASLGCCLETCEKSCANLTLLPDLCVPQPGAYPSLGRGATLAKTGTMWAACPWWPRPW